MERAASAEFLFLLDEFLWEEELVELAEIPDKINSSDAYAIDQLIQLLNDHPSGHQLYPHLLSLFSIILGDLGADSTVQTVYNHAGSVLSRPDACEKIFISVLSRLDQLVDSISKNPVSLSRDTSRISLSHPSTLTDPAVISSEVRLCLNILFVCVFFQSELSNNQSLHSTLQSALLLQADPTIPVRKIVLLIFRLLSFDDSSIYLPSNVASDSIASLHSVPLLRLPLLSNFRSFIAVAAHQSSLRAWMPEGSVRALPAALEEGIDICEKAMIEFIKNYKFHEAEIDLLRSNPETSHAFLLYSELARKGTVGKTRRDLIRPKNMDGGRFAVKELANQIVSNYQLISNPLEKEEDESDGGSSVESLPHLPLVQEAFRSCHSWLCTEQNQDELIEAIADAAVRVPIGLKYQQSHVVVRGPERFTHDVLRKFYSEKILKQIILVLLKLLLSACRGATDPSLSPTNHASFDLDRDHLITLLERSEVHLPTAAREESSKRNFEIITNAISGIILLLLKHHHEEAELIQTLISSSNGCLVLLKLITSFPSDNAVFYDVENDSIFPFLRENKSWGLAVPARLPTTVFRALKSLYILCKHSPSRIKKFLVHYKVAVVLKRFFTTPNAAILKVSYKLFKIQMRYLGKKWKHLHIKLLSSCYNATSLELLDDWLLADPDPENTEISPHALNESREVAHERTSRADAETDYENYLEEIRRVDFSDPRAIQKFCDQHGENVKEFFGPGGIASYSEWLRYGVGL